jgi:hypothetical protein
LPSSGRPASQEPRWGTATLSTSCECADVLAPAIMATVQNALMNIVRVIILPPAKSKFGIAIMRADRSKRQVS